MSDNRQKRIEQRAYEIWEREGRLSGLDAENWQRAEEEIAREEAGSATPEDVPAEAEAKPAEAEAKPATEDKPERVTKAKAKPAASERASEAPARSPKAAEKAGTPAAEIQEKGARKRKTSTKKK